MPRRHEPDPTEQMFERLSQNPDVERGLHRLEDNPNEDPALRQMARAVLEECEQGKKRIEQRKVANAIGCVAFVIFIFIGIIILVARGGGAK